MLRSLKELLGYRVTAKDGDIGTVHDFLLEGGSRDIRYVVAETGSWVERSHVLLARTAFGEVHWPTRAFPVRLTVEQARRSPEVTWDSGLSREEEHRLHKHYEWLPYWLAEGWGATDGVEPGELPDPVPDYPSLLHVRKLLGAVVRGTDLDLGHVADLIVDDETWRLRSLIVDTEYWWPQSIVMVDMAKVMAFNAPAHAFDVAMNREQIAESPPYNEHDPVNRRHELVLYDYLGKPHMA